jgi:simple sugar transport system ATP-binding protein
MAASEVSPELWKGLDPSARVENLSVGQRQRLEILKALASGASILLLDEPSAVLAPSEVEELLRLLRDLARGGRAVALITHKLPEVLAGADRVTVLRKGNVTLAAPIAQVTERSLVEAMVGAGGKRESGTGKGEREKGKGGREVARIGTHTIHAGELVGLGAIEGNGQRALLRALAGLASMPELSVSGSVAFVPEDRTTEGLIPEFSVTENVVLGLLNDGRWSRGVRLDWAAARRATAGLIEGYNIMAPGPDSPAGTLSGGNQQKIVLARALERRPSLLVAENPTRGLDIRATQDVHERLRAATRGGIAVLVYSTDLDEVLELAERVLVMHAGRLLEAPSGAGNLVGQLCSGRHGLE